MTTRKQYRQGDVLLVESPLPDGVALRRARRVRVAEGEATGHAHVLEAPKGTTIERDVDGEFLRIVGANGLLTHEEHATIEVPPGDYHVVRQREYAPGEIRRVAD